MKALGELLPVIAQREDADSESYPAETIADLYRIGLPQAPFAGASVAECTDAIELLATASPSAALIAAMPLGLAGIFASEGAPAEQRERLAADYARGRVYAACNSEKGAGGSLAATKTTAVRNESGFTISGEKILASSGRFAHTFFSTARVRPEDVPGGGIVEFFFIASDAPGVEILADWDGFGMRSTESQTVRYTNAPVRELMGFPNFIEAFQPLQVWFCLFAAIPLGAARAILEAMSQPAPTSPALRLRLAEARMRYEALHAYLQETARAWRPAAGPEYASRVLRTKTYVSQEATKLCAELFALSGGRHYRRAGRLARFLADSFAGTALRPPLSLALDNLEP